MPTASSNVRVRGQSGKHMLVLSSSQSDPSPTSPLRQPGHAHALNNALAPGEVSRIVARCADAEASDVEAWIERKSRLRDRPRLTQRAEQCKGSSEPKMRRRIISVSLDASTEPSDCFGICIELHLGEANIEQPPEGVDIARREAERFVDMDLGLCAAAD